MLFKDVQSINKDRYCRRFISFSNQNETRMKPVLHCKFPLPKWSSYGLLMLLICLGSGFRAQAQDAEVSQLLSPQNSCSTLSSATEIKLVVENKGTTVLTAVPLAYQIGTATPQRDTLFRTLNPGDTANFSFRITADFSTAGRYSIMLWAALAADADRTNDTLKNIIVYSGLKPSVTFKGANVCSYDSVYFVNTSTVIGGKPVYHWDFGDGDTSSLKAPAHLYKKPGLYNVMLKVGTSLGCKDSVQRSVTIYTPPAADFITSTPVCISSDVVFLNKSTTPTGTLTYSWDFGDGNTSVLASPLHTYAKPKVYQVQLVVTNTSGCKDTVIKDLKVNELPSLEFHPSRDTVCGPDTVRFYNFSSYSAGLSHLAYQWDFGDGATSTVRSPIHSYTKLGTYSVHLKISSDSGCFVEDSSYVTFVPRPDATFVASTISCASEGVQFKGGNVQGGGKLTFQWNFDDGTFSTLESPRHFYTSPGIYRPSLILISESGCFDTSSIGLAINATPGASFTAASVCSGNPVSFTNNSSINGGSITAYNWDFGDGNTSTQKEPQHLYAGPGKYDVRLIVTGDKGCEDTTIKSVTVFERAKPSFSVSNTCRSDSAVFHNTTTISSSDTLSYHWDFGDGNSSNLAAPSHLYGLSGNFKVVLTATTSQGCSDTVSKLIRVFPSVKADFNNSIGCLKDSLRFTNTSNSKAGIKSSVWLFGDGNFSLLPNPAHLYATPGSYRVMLTVTTPDGCMDTVSKLIAVAAPPQAAFVVSTPDCNNKTVQFSDASVSNGDSLKYTWDFGDGMTSGDASPAHLFDSAGSYRVKLKVSAGSGCPDTISHLIVINKAPQANFTAADVCIGDSMAFINQTNVNGSTITYHWDFGDGAISGRRLPFHIYSAAGSYAAVLTAASAAGCTDTFRRIVNVQPTPSAAFTFSRMQDTVIFRPTDLSQHSYFWNFGDGRTSTDKIAHHLFAPGTSATVSLLVTNVLGCQDSSSIVFQNVGIAPVEATTVGINLNIYPNPFKGQTSITYTLDHPAVVSLEVYNILGERAGSLLTAKQQNSGSYHYTFTSPAGNAAAGLYIVRLVVGDRQEERRLMELK
jgi:PKD repeat protein